MPDLAESLQGFDLGHIKIIAELWGIELSAPDVRAAIPRLVPAICNAELVSEIVEGLPNEAHTALVELRRNGGRMPWAQFSRQYGQVREMGAGRRDREMPWRNPVSAVEILWYRALLARAFFDTPRGAEEFVYIPDDLLRLISFQLEDETIVYGRSAYPAERAQVTRADDQILDHACTLLAALRLRRELPPEYSDHHISARALQGLLSAAGLVDASGLPVVEAVRKFLEASRGEALAILARVWQESNSFNELRLIPSFTCEGEWRNDPRLTRQRVLGFLTTVPLESWWSLPAFVQAVRQKQPDYQRPAGDYDSWFIRNLQTGEFLRGFENWDHVDGELLRYMITGPLHWLGMVNLASPTPGEQVSAFQLTKWAEALLSGGVPAGLMEEKEPLQVRSDGVVYLPRLTPRSVRYQVARFCQWEKETAEAYTYRLSADSLALARQQGLTTHHLLTLLRRYADAVPPNLVRALERWEEHGSQAQVERLTILRVATPEILQVLRSSRAARYLREPLGPTAIIVKSGAGEKVLAILVELGFIGELRDEN